MNKRTALLLVVSLGFTNSDAMPAPIHNTVFSETLSLCGDGQSFGLEAEIGGNNGDPIRAMRAKASQVCRLGYDKAIAIKFKNGKKTLSWWVTCHKPKELAAAPKPALSC